MAALVCLCGTETWILTTKTEIKSQFITIKLLRVVKECTKTDTIRYQGVQEQLNNAALVKK